MTNGSARRIRSKTMAFRVTPEEYEEICELARLSGMDRQDYIVSRLKNKEVIVKPSPKIHKALKDDMAKIYVQLLRIRAGSELKTSTENTLRILAGVFAGLKPDDASMEMSEENNSVWNLERR